MVSQGGRLDFLSFGRFSNVACHKHALSEIRKPVFVAFGDLKAAGFHILVIVEIQSAKIGDFQCKKS